MTAVRYHKRRSYVTYLFTNQAKISVKKFLKEAPRQILRPFKNSCHG